MTGLLKKSHNLAGHATQSTLSNRKQHAQPRLHSYMRACVCCRLLLLHRSRRWRSQPTGGGRLSCSGSSWGQARLRCKGREVRGPTPDRAGAAGQVVCVIGQSGSELWNMCNFICLACHVVHCYCCAVGFVGRNQSVFFVVLGQGSPGGVACLAPRQIRCYTCNEPGRNVCYLFCCRPSRGSACGCAAPD